MGKLTERCFFLCKILSSNENPRRAEGINIRTRCARWNTFRVMWIYLAHPSGDESSEKCHLGRHLGGDWTRSYPSRPVTFCFLSSNNSWRLPIGLSGDIKSNENSFSHIFPCSFNCGCTLNLAIWQAETRPLLMHPIMCQYWFQISWFCPVDRWGVHGLALTGDVNFSIIFSLIKSSAAAQAGTVIFRPEKIFGEIFLFFCRVTFNGLHCCVVFNGPERASRGGKKTKQKVL